MKINVRKTIISLLLGSIGVTALSLSFSLAWYASSANLYVDTLVVTVSGSRDLKISTSENGYYAEELGYNDLDHVALFKPVSSMFKEDWTENKHSDPTLYEYTSPFVNSNFEPEYSRATSGYYAQHLFLKSDGSTRITLDAENLKVEANASMNRIQARELHEKYPEYTEEELYERLGTLVNCVRIGIIDPDIQNYNFMILDPYKNGETVLGGREDLLKSGYYNYYKNNLTGEQYETLYGEITNRDKAVYGEVAEEDIVPEGELTSFNAKTLKGVRPFDLEASLANGLEIGTEDSCSINEGENDFVEDNFYLTLEAFKPKEIVLMIYMEGWDRDCINQHMGGSFNIDLQFKIAEQQ